ncbi:MAG: hypothetical protein GY742_18060 [Hyphomicrobiales bacterium]|nr:hypothetical protein [Hyphomicrobiales bacterium]
MREPQADELISSGKGTQFNSAKKGLRERVLIRFKYYDERGGYALGCERMCFTKCHPISYKAILCFHV